MVLYAISCGKNADNTGPGVSGLSDTKETTYSNPLLPSGPDPWVVQKDTIYYYTHTLGDRIAIYSTNRMAELHRAPVTAIWNAPSTGPYSRNIWAPEIHFLRGKWYAYFAADDGNNSNHRMYVLENSSSDPLSGKWNFKGKISDPSDKWAIDGSVFEYRDRLYFIWSGWEADADGRQDIYIAKMSDPWTIEGNRVMISSPSYSWESIGSPDVNEGPQIIENSRGKIYLTYSASGCWTDDYALGLLSLRENGDPLNTADWTKLPVPVFVKSPDNGVYAPGHNCFFKSRDGKEDWILYHANSSAGQGCSNARSPRMQKITWNADGSPHLGQPAPVNVKLKRPGGE